MLQNEGREKSSISSSAAASPFQDRDREHGTIALWWEKRCLHSSPTPKTPSHLSTTKALGPFCSEDAQPSRTTSKHNTCPFTDPFPPSEQENEPCSRERARKLDREAKGRGRAQWDVGNRETLSPSWEVLYKIPNCRMWTGNSQIGRERHGAEGQSRSEDRGEESRHARRPFPGEMPAGFSLMSKQDLVNSRTSALQLGRKASPAG